jgi:predicted neutral ceramidase superfamily lipid hydrolase
MLSLFIPFLLAHFIGDFVLQPDKWVKAKSSPKNQFKYLFYHIGVHALTLLILLKFQFKYGVGILIIVLSHFIIDWAKIKFQNKKNEIILFFTDQLAHLFVIAIVVYGYEPYAIDTKIISFSQLLLLLMAIIMQTQVTAIIIKVLLSKWKMKEDYPNQAGKYIGMLERLFIFSFVLMNYWEGVGFLLGAKSIFRFGDLNNAKDRNLTEYVLIGTLISFGLAMIIARAYKYLNLYL